LVSEKRGGKKREEEGEKKKVEITPIVKKLKRYASCKSKGKKTQQRERGGKKIFAKKMRRKELVGKEEESNTFRTGLERTESYRAKRV